MALALGGRIGPRGEVEFVGDLSPDDRRDAVRNFVKAAGGEASMMARCTGKTNVHNLEPEDLCSIALVTAEAVGVPLAGTPRIS
jgi:hypothetical protein